jgi:hypothetical protein
MNDVTITLNADGTFTGSNGKELKLRDVIKMARVRRDKANEAKRKAHASKQAERKATRLAKAQARLAKAQAELEKLAA